jgi:hypothetical protein
MAGIWMAVAVVGLVVSIGVALFYRRRAPRGPHDTNFGRARREFHLQREHLEAKFFELAASSGKPRGLEWTSCEFDDEVSYARNRETGDLAALVAVTIRFAAIAGGGMEDVPAVGNLRAATAVFAYADKQWRTDGRAIFNLNPAEAIRHFHSSLEMVAQDPATRV